ncbi:MAG: hypothetical protein ACKVHP_15235, partial [Verrucomicrobiales bacterium]
AMTRWAVLFARGLGVGLKVIIAKGEAKEFASVVPEKEDTSSHWSEVEAALLDMGLTRIVPRPMMPLRLTFR